MAKIGKVDILKYFNSPTLRKGAIFGKPCIWSQRRLSEVRCQTCLEMAHWVGWKGKCMVGRGSVIQMLNLFAWKMLFEFTAKQFVHKNTASSIIIMSPEKIFLTSESGNIFRLSCIVGWRRLGETLQVPWQTGRITIQFSTKKTRIIDGPWEEQHFFCQKALLFYAWSYI